jgi:hypothetical protein
MRKKEDLKVTSNIRLEGAQLIFKNFAGKQTDYNNAGNRNFGVLLDPELAESLIEDGWNIKHLKPREDDPDQFEQPWIPVKVKFEPYPPVCQLITSRGKLRLTEETIDQLDWSIIESCDLVIRPYNYPAIAGRPAGVSAYLKAMYVTVVEDDFAKKYADIPDLDAPVYADEYEDEE